MAGSKPGLSYATICLPHTLQDEKMHQKRWEAQKRGQRLKQEVVTKQAEEKKSKAGQEKRPTIPTAQGSRASLKHPAINDGDLEVLEVDGLIRKNKKPRTASSKSVQNQTVGDAEGSSIQDSNPSRSEEKSNEDLGYVKKVLQ
ncbi:Uncharacterized protein Fot_04705 [Forsythia ovata]|uniref:Uncharacterized protein n=1 Tax=Forsythia ovata TaxID=205694 RepID=A0ABD1XDA9_9LAMI